MRYSDLLENKDFEVRKIFGKILFGTFRQLPEEDTKIEAEIFKTIDYWIRGISRPENKMIEILKKYKEYFPDLLIPESGIIYRGRRISIRYFKNLKFKRGTWSTSQILYKPQYKVESWTYNQAVALGIAVSGSANSVDDPLNLKQGIDAETEALLNILNYDTSPPKDIAVLIKINTANTSDDLLLTPKLSNQIAAQYGYREDEIFRVSSKPIKASLLIHSDWINIMKKFDKRPIDKI